VFLKVGSNVAFAAQMYKTPGQSFLLKLTFMWQNKSNGESRGRNSITAAYFSRHTDLV
jgi:hypothetical protein